MTPRADNPMDEEIDFIVQRLVDMVQDIPEDVPPFGSVRLTTDERCRRYEEMRDSPQAWMDLLNEHGLKVVIHEATRMEQQYQEWLEEQERDEQRKALDGIEFGAGPMDGAQGDTDDGATEEGVPS